MQSFVICHCQPLNCQSHTTHTHSTYRIIGKRVHALLHSWRQHCMHGALTCTVSSKTIIQQSVIAFCCKSRYFARLVTYYRLQRLIEWAFSPFFKQDKTQCNLLTYAIHDLSMIHKIELRKFVISAAQSYQSSDDRIEFILCSWCKNWQSFGKMEK